MKHHAFNKKKKRRAQIQVDQGRSMYSRDAKPFWLG